MSRYILMMFTLFAGDVELLATGDYPPMTYYYQKKPRLEKLWTPKQPRPQYRSHDFGKLARKAPKFAKAEQEPSQNHHLFWEINAGAPKLVWKEWETIPGYKRVPQTVYDYNQRVSPKITRPRRPISIFRKRDAIIRYTEKFTY